MRKRLDSSDNKNVNKIPREEARMKDLSASDSRIASHRKINSDDISNLFHKVQIINKNEVLLKSIKPCDTTVCSEFL